MKEILKMKWYPVGSPWLPPDTPTYIVAGNEDPHGATMVCDMPDDFDSGDMERAELIDQGWSIAHYICGLHNKHLSESPEHKSLAFNDITEIIPDNMPVWVQKAMDEGQFFTKTLGRIRQLEQQLEEVSDLCHNNGGFADEAIDLIIDIIEPQDDRF